MTGAAGGSGHPSLRVLQVSDLYPPVPGGLELAVEATAEGLAARGHTVEVVTQAVGPPGPVPAGSPAPDGRVAVRRVRGLGSRLAARGVYAEAQHPLHPTAPDPWMVAELRRTIDRFRPDVVHAHGWIAYSVLAAVGAGADRRGRPPGPAVVVGLHDYSLVCAKKTMMEGTPGRVCPGPGRPRCRACTLDHYGATRGLALGAAMALSAPLYRRADAFVANSRAVAAASGLALPAPAPSDPLEPGPAPGPGGRPARSPLVEVIAPPVGAPVPCAAGADRVRPGFLPAGDGFVMFAGALAPHKGLPVLLEAHEHHGLGAPLVVLGARRHDTPRRWPAGVTVVRDVPHREVLAAWAHAGVAVVPSVWPEPFGMVAVEAMAAGVPVVAAAGGGLAEIVVDGVTGALVRPGDPAGLARAVRDLVADPQRRARMGEAARQRAGLYSAGRSLDRLEDLYRRVLAGR